MSEMRDWRGMWGLYARLLKEQTGEDVVAWNKRVVEGNFKDEQELRVWLTLKGVTGYAQQLLVMERFGYPEFMLASADELIDGQYADRPHLRPILDAVLAAVSSLGPVTIQARKTYVSLLTPRRTFARVQPTTRKRVDIALRLEGHQPGGRLAASKIQENSPVQVGLESVEELDVEVLDFLQKAYQQNL